MTVVRSPSDWFVRDFFLFLCNRPSSFVAIPGTNEQVQIGTDWRTKAESAREIALDASYKEYNDWTILAGEEWQKIFGNRILAAVI